MDCLVKYAVDITLKDFFFNKNTDLSIKSHCLIFTASTCKLCHITLICKALKI